MKYLTTILTAIAVIIPLASFAQDNTTSPEALAFTISGMINGNWKVTGEPIYGNSNIQTELITTNILGNSYWKAECFGITGTNNWNELRCGAYMPTTPTIYNLSPIPNKISKVICNLTLKSGGDKNKISCIRLKVSPSENMDDAIVQQIENPSLNPSFNSFEFSIDDPKDNMFYRIELECPTSSASEGGLAFNSLSFYRQLSPTPLINKIYDADNKIDHIEVVSEIGDLHLLVNEYDLDGNHIREVIGPNTPPAQNSPAKAAPEYPADWTNHVAEANTAYVVNLPTEPNHMILIRAKSLNDGIHSTETSTIFTDAGIETGISPISTDTDNTPIYYNMQGIRVERPSASGLYLRVQNGKTTKIHIP